MFVLIIPVLLNLIPNIIARLITQPGFKYLGNASWFDPWDVNVYVAAIRYGQQNQSILLENFYTTLLHPKTVFYPLYTLAGSIFKFLDPYLLFHLLAILFGLLLVYSIYKIVTIFISSKKDRHIATLLISIGGGLGWMFVNAINSPDLAMTGFTFLSAFQRAHEAIGLSIYLLLLYFLYNGLSSRNLLVSFVFLTLEVFFYPYLIVSYLLIALIFSLYIWVEKKNGVLLKKVCMQVVLIFFPTLLYILMLKNNPGFNLVYSVKLDNPNIIELIIGYGILSPIFFIQLFKNRKDDKWIFLNLWFILSLVLSYIPLGFSRFYLKSLYAPLVILAFLNIKHIASKLKLQYFTLHWLVILIICIYPFYIFFQRIKSAYNINRWVYYSNEEQNAINYLNGLPPGSGILSLYRMGNLIPAKTNNRVFFGHILQTPRGLQKIDQAAKFFNNRMDEKESRRFLISNNIKYVYYGFEEKSLNNNFINNNLDEAYQSSNIKIYAVKNN